MEMHQIRYVLAAAEFLNFTRAAAACDVSQPALTKGIKALETELNAPIFHRDGRRIILSQLGQTLLPHLRQIASEAEAAQTLAQNYNLLTDVPVRVGVQSTIGPVQFSHFLAAYETAHESVELAVSMGKAAELSAALQADALDLAIVTRLPELDGALKLIPLFRERYVVILPPAHALAAKSEIRLSDVSGLAYVDRLECEMRETVRATCESRSVDLYARFRADRDDWVQGIVHAGLGFAFMPEMSVTQEGLVSRPLADPIVERDVCLATIPGRPYSPAVAALVRLAQSYVWAP
ncbi:MAG: LysR family transcriptional regulator [Pseudomonadota bacterium]